MAVYDYDMGVIGGGAAGLTVAAGAARLGVKTLLVEKEGRLGGDCLHYGCVPSKTLIRTASVYHYMKNAARFGLPAMDVPAVNYRDIASRISSVIETIQRHDSPERFEDLGVKVEFGIPFFRDEHSIELNGRTVSARKWVIATGSSPSVPPIDGIKDTTYLTNRDIFSLEDLPRSMIVLGGGPIAIEMAQAFSRLGTDVTVVQRSGQILSREDADMAETVMRVLETEGVKFILNARIESVKDVGGEREVRVTAGGEETVIRAGALFVAMGRRANVDGLALENAGIESGPKGLRVDRRLRTTCRHIYAAGDVTGENQFTHAAGYEGGVVIANAVFHLPRRVNYSMLPWCIYTEPELASIGFNEKRAKESGLEYTVWTEEFRTNDRALAEEMGEGRIKLLLDRKERPVGVQIVGLHAGELLSEWVAALNGRVRISTLAAAVHPYPTLAEINKKVAGTVMSGKLFSPKVRRLLRLFFRYRG